MEQAFVLCGIKYYKVTLFGAGPCTLSEWTNPWKEKGLS